MGIVVLFLSSAGPAGAQGWTASLEIGAARAVSGASIFHDTGQLQASAMRHLGERLLTGAFIDFRPVLDQTPASSFWYADLGLRADLAIYRRLFGALSAGWALRHIGLPDGVSNTVGGVALAAGLGGTVAARKGVGAIYLLATAHASWAVKSEDITVVDVGLAIGCRLDLGAKDAAKAPYVR